MSTPVTKHLTFPKNICKFEVGSIHVERTPIDQWFWCLTEIKEYDTGFTETWIRLEKDS